MHIILCVFSQELKAFGDRCEALSRQFVASEAFRRKCAIYGAFTLIDAFSKKLQILEGEAQVSGCLRAAFISLLQLSCCSLSMSVCVCLVVYLPDGNIFY